ncbi:MAG: Rpn family recombination-promoting nuclease/putative transposase [Planctomycetes bacterium]|nr:Rpn family recombination-promoting nuclease/putative transposase [Planctomycetota bacterium]
MYAPHDRLFEFTFRHAAHAAGWLRSVLPRGLAATVDWTGLAPIRERFPGVRARPHLVDAAFVAPLRSGGRTLDLLLPVEHKSFGDPGLALQLLRYSVHLQRALQSEPGHPPPVLAVVLRHGPTPARPAPGTALPPGLRPFQPRQRIVTDDLTACSEDDLARRGLSPLAELTLLCLRHLPHAAPAGVPAAFERWQHLLRAVDATAAPPFAPPLGADAIDAIGWYALAATDVESLQLAETFARILHRDPRSIMSTLERTFQAGVRKGHEAGKAEGKAEGTNEGHAHALLLQLAHRFGPLDAAVTARIRAGSRGELDRWTRRVLDAATIAGVFAEDAT